MYLLCGLFFLFIILAEFVTVSCFGYIKDLFAAFRLDFTLYRRPYSVKNVIHEFMDFIGEINKI